MLVTLIVASAVSRPPCASNWRNKQFNGVDVEVIRVGSTTTMRPHVVCGSALLVCCYVKASGADGRIPRARSSDAVGGADEQN